VEPILTRKGAEHGFEELEADIATLVAHSPISPHVKAGAE
jgi:hypothetical protein